MTTVERLWLLYCALVVGIAVAVDGGGAAGHRPLAFAAVHGLVAAAQAVPLWFTGRGRVTAARCARGILGCVGLPVVFSALAFLLPHVHPEPYELAWYRADLAVFGCDVTRALRQGLAPSAVLALQLVYAAFYLLPIAAVLAAGRAGGGSAYDRALTLVVGSFLLSYLGYLWFPTLGPKVVLPVVSPGGGELAAAIGAAIDRAEANPWDCFPSGHTMLSLVSAVVVWRWARRALPWFLLVIVPLVASTLCLRYHWPIDVLAGGVGALVATRWLDFLLACDARAPGATPAAGANGQAIW